MEQGTSVPGLRVSGRVEGDRAHLDITGDVDLGTAQAVRGAVCEALDAGALHIEVDLKGVGFLDSTGLNVLLHAARDADRRHAALRVLAPVGGQPRVVIEMARVDRLLDVS